jgi:hypothetical protein
VEKNISKEKQYFLVFSIENNEARKNEHRSIHQQGCIYQKRVAQIPAAKTIGSCALGNSNGMVWWRWLRLRSD